MRCLLVLFLTCAAIWADDRVLVDRVGSTGFVQLHAESFQKLSPRQQALTYWLAQASIAIDPINYDQNSRFGLRQKRLLEAIVRAWRRRSTRKIVAFTKLFWANRGNHNEHDRAEVPSRVHIRGIESRCCAALAKGAFASNPYGTPVIRNQADLDRELNELRASLFDPAFEPSDHRQEPARQPWTSCNPAPIISTRASVLPTSRIFMRRIR